MATNYYPSVSCDAKAAGESTVWEAWDSSKAYFDGTKDVVACELTEGKSAALRFDHSIYYKQYNSVRGYFIKTSFRFDVGSNFGRSGNAHCTLEFYLLDKDPRQFRPADIPSKAIAKKTISEGTGSIVNTVIFDNIHIYTRDIRYLVVRHIGGNAGSTIQLGNFRTSQDEYTLSSLGLSIYGMDDAVGGEPVQFRIQNRNSEPVVLEIIRYVKTYSLNSRLSYIGEIPHKLYSATVNSDIVEIPCQKSWLEDAGAGADGLELYARVSSDIWKNSGNTVKFRLLWYDIQIKSSDVLEIGEDIVAKLRGLDESQCEVSLKHDATVFKTWTNLQEATIREKCKIDWFINAGVSANEPMQVEIAVGITGGGAVKKTFTLNVPKLTISGDKSSVKTGEGDNSKVAFAVGNRTVEGRQDEELTFRILSGETAILTRTLSAESTDVMCVKEWFEAANIRTSKQMNLSASVTDVLGREGRFGFRLNAGSDMEPTIERAAASIVQHAAAQAFPETYIAGFSRAKIIASVDRQTSAAISSVRLAYDSKEVSMYYNATSDCYEAVTASPLTKDTTFTVKVTDERGFVKTAIVTVNNVHLYMPPSFVINSLFRCDEYGNEKVGGTWYKINVTATFDDTLPGNELVIFESSVVDAEGRDAQSLESGVDFVFPSGLNTSKRFTVQVSIRDRLSSTITVSSTLTGGVNLISAYNELVDKYRVFNDGLKKISDKIVGYPALMQSYYNTIDMELFLRSGLMPSVSSSSTDAQREAAKLTSEALSPVAVSNLNSCSATTAASAVLGSAKCLVRSSYQVTIESSSYNQSTHIWTGKLTVTNFADDEDTATTGNISVEIDADLVAYTRQRLALALKQESDDVTNISELFKLGSAAFRTEMGKYAMQRLVAFRQACQACLDMMMQSGASNVSRVENLIRFSAAGTDDISSGNLLALPYCGHDAGYSDTVAGVSYTINGNGSIRVNGQNTGSERAAFLTLLDYTKMEVGTYKVKGGANKAGVTLRVVTTTSPGVNTGIVNDFSADANNRDGITVLGGQSAEGKDLYLMVCLEAAPNGNINNVTVNPTLVRTYANDGSQDGSGGIDVNAYQQDKEVTIRGVTCHVNTDGSITLNGTSTGAFQYYFADQHDGHNLPRGYYQYTLNTAASGVGAIFGEEKKLKNSDSSYSYSIQQSVYRSDDKTNGPFTVVVEGADARDSDGGEFTGNVVIGFSIEAGETFENYIIKPQLESGTVLHDWVSPADGVAVNSSMSQHDNVYHNLYQPYLIYLNLIDEEIRTREHELEIVVGEYDANGNLITDGAQTILLAERDAIQRALDFEAFLGESLWKEFASYRREDSLSNENYISDGLDNAELFSAAEDFIKEARREIQRAAEAQHSISGQLRDMLTMEEFRPLVKDMCVGNWIRVGVDGTPYKLRLYSYEIDYENMGFSVEFTNLRRGGNGSSDVNDLLNRVRSMSVSYGAVARQAQSGQKSADIVDDWNENGIPISSRIIGSDGNQELLLDQSGLSGREFSADTQMYSPAQVKFMPGGIFATTDAWLTGKTVVGKYSFRNPETGQIVEGYGSVAELLLGHMLLENGYAVFSQDGSVIINENGIKTSSLTVTGNLQVRGTKNRVAATRDYGDRLMYSYETASPMFGDVGEGVIGEDGECSVALDEMFTETISDGQYQVFLQRYGDGDCYVSERGRGFFIVNGTPGMRFGWELKAGQAGYEGVRMESAAK